MRLRAIHVLVTLLVLASPALGQGSGCLPSADEVKSRAVRIVIDRGTQSAWMVQKEPTHPSFPPRMKRIPNGHACEARGEAPKAIPMSLRQNVVVVHYGESVVVVENSPVVSVRLQAIALGEAGADEPVTVRLKTGSTTLRAFALGPGLVTLAGDALGGRR